MPTILGGCRSQRLRPQDQDGTAHLREDMGRDHCCHIGLEAEASLRCATSGG